MPSKLLIFDLSKSVLWILARHSPLIFKSFRFGSISLSTRTNWTGEKKQLLCIKYVTTVMVMPKNNV